MIEKYLISPHIFNFLFNFFVSYFWFRLNEESSRDLGFGQKQKNKHSIMNDCSSEYYPHESTLDLDQ